MSDIEKISITVPHEMAAIVRSAVAEGSYASTSEVMRDALRLWKERRDCFGHTLEELQALVKAGQESGPAKAWDKEAFLAQARSQLKD